MKTIKSIILGLLLLRSFKTYSYKVHTNKDFNHIFSK